MAKKFFVIFVCFFLFFFVFLVIYPTVAPTLEKQQNDAAASEFPAAGKGFEKRKKKLDYQDVYFWDERKELLDDKVCFFPNGSRVVTAFEKQASHPNQFVPFRMMAPEIIVKNKTEFFMELNRNPALLIFRGATVVLQDTFTLSGNMCHVYENLAPLNNIIKRIGCPLEFERMMSNEALNFNSRSRLVVPPLPSFEAAAEKIGSSKFIRLFHWSRSAEFPTEENPKQGNSILLLWETLLTSYTCRGKSPYPTATPSLNPKNGKNTDDDTKINSKRKGRNHYLIHAPSTVLKEWKYGKNEKFLFSPVASMNDVIASARFDAVCFDAAVLPQPCSRTEWFEKPQMWKSFHKHSLDMCNLTTSTSAFSSFSSSSSTSSSSLGSSDIQLASVTGSGSGSGNRKKRVILILDRDIYRSFEDPEEMILSIKKKLKKNFPVPVEVGNQDSKDLAEWQVKYLTTHDLTTSSQCSIVNKLNEADILISPHGYQLSYSIFLKEGSPIIEIFPNRYVQKSYGLLSQSMNRSHFFLEGKPNDFIGKLIPRSLLDSEESFKYFYYRTYFRSMDVLPDYNELWNIIKQAIDVVNSKNLVSEESK